MTLKALLDEVKATSHDVLEQLKRLVVEGQVSIVSPEWQTNTHISFLIEATLLILIKCVSAADYLMLPTYTNKGS